MSELFLELFSEEIPARMQARAAEDLARLLTGAFAALAPADVRTFHGPRRIALAATVAAGVAAASTSERGPRLAAPEAALTGFLRKHGAAREQLWPEGAFWVLDKHTPGQDAAGLVATVLPVLLRRFPWPKSMRWGGTSAFTWVRPLRRIVCLLDGAVVPFDLRDNDDDGHGLASSDLSEGHRFLSPGTFRVTSAAQWQAELRARHVIADPAERRQAVADGIALMAARTGLLVVDDPGLLDEVAGLVEWPVPLLGAIDDACMDLPAEVMQVSMRVNQRYFALRHPDGRAAPVFAFAANIAAPDGGRTIIAGNERVLRARFSDARHFWDLDRKRTLESRVAALDAVTFHARLGSQGDRVRRLMLLAGEIGRRIGARPGIAERAAQLSKSDLLTGMVGEFPELQGVMGGYYARHDREDEDVAGAIANQYLNQWSAPLASLQPPALALALADRLDQIVAFFGVGEKPTGSGDPYALRRAALGILRILRERGLRLNLRELIAAAAARLAAPPDPAEVMDFLVERLRVQLRTEGARHDVLNAVLGAESDDDLVRVLARADAVAALLGTTDGADLLAAYRRAANILRIEERADGPHDGTPDEALLEQDAERRLAAALDDVLPRMEAALAQEAFGPAMAALAGLRGPLDAFFDDVTVNDARPELRRNRLRLLSRVRAAMDRAADFSRIEGQEHR